MTTADERAQAAGILAWAYVSTFVFLTSVGTAFYSSQGIDPSPQFEMVYRWGVLTLVWYWIACQGRLQRTALLIDAGFFVVLLGPLAAPLLLRRQRRRSLLKTAILVGIFVAGYLLSVVLHFVLVAMQ
jgi:hypothetical protein